MGENFEGEPFIGEPFMGDFTMEPLPEPRGGERVPKFQREIIRNILNQQNSHLIDMTVYFRCEWRLTTIMQDVILLTINK